jgi:hypothetical protein
LIRRLFKKKKKERPTANPEPIPWDVPLDKTMPKFHRYGDTTSV